MSCSERFWMSFFIQTFPKHILYGISCTTLLWSQLIHLGGRANGACYNTSYHSQPSLQNPVPHSVCLAKDKVISCHLGFSLLQVVAKTGSPNWHFYSINCQNIFPTCSVFQYIAANLLMHWVISPLPLTSHGIIFEISKPSEECHSINPEFLPYELIITRQSPCHGRF